MTLKDYIKHLGRGGLTTLAAEVGTSKGYIHDLVNDPNRLPSVEMAKRIEKATGGRVTAVALLGLEPPAKRKAKA